MVIWLGEKEADDARAFDTMIRLKRILEKEPTESDLQQQMWNSEGGPDEVPAGLGKEWRVLSDLLSKWWFTRAWIVQEVPRARNATLVCGDLTLDFESFLETILDILTSCLVLISITVALSSSRRIFRPST